MDDNEVQNAILLVFVETMILLCIILTVFVGHRIFHCKSPELNIFKHYCDTIPFTIHNRTQMENMFVRILGHWAPSVIK